MKTNWLLLALWLITKLISAQSVWISGSVTKTTGQELGYVNVYVKDTFDGSMTDANGYFAFSTTRKDTIIIIASMIGYEKFTRSVIPGTTDSTDINITLRETSVELKEAVVSGSSYSSEKEKGLVISRIDVYTTPGGAADLFQSIKALPGISQVSESAELYVRGGDPSETLTIVDQANLYHPYTYESSYGGLFSNLNTAMIKNMFFSSGGFSAKYGNALSGILEVETIDEPVSNGFNIGISMAAISGTCRLNLIDNKLGLNVLANKSYTKPIMWLNGGLDRFTSTPTSQDLTGSLVYKYSESGRIKLLTLTAVDRTGVKVERPETVSRFDGNTGNTFLNLQQKDILYNKLLIKNSISYGRHSNEWVMSLLDIDMIDETYKTRTDVEYNLSGTWKLSAGTEASIRKESFTGKLPLNDFDIRSEAQYKLIDDHIDQIHYGVYFESEKHNILGVSKLNVITGLRSDHFPDFNITWLDPRLTLSFTLDSASNINFSWGIFHQIPESRLFSPTDGNPDLKAMKAMHFILSYNYSFDEQSNLRIEVYYKNYNNLPLEDKLTNYSNNGDGYASGLDFIIKGELPYGISGWISYGYLKTERLWMDYAKPTKSDFDITHQLTIISKYNISALWQVGINFKLASGRPYTPVIGSVYNLAYKINEPIYGIKNSDRYPVYKRLDFRITHFNLLFGRYNTIFYLEGMNILNIENIFGYTYNSDYSNKYKIKSYFGRRTIVVGTSISF